MGAFTAALAAFGILQAGQQMAAGYAARGQAQYNAAIAEHQAKIAEAQKGFSEYQYSLKRSQYAATITSQTGKKGIALTGSPLAILTDVDTNIKMDSLIEKYNLEQEKQYQLAVAENYRIQGRTAMKLAQTNMFSTLLQTGFMVGSRLGSAKTPTTNAKGVSSYESYTSKQPFSYSFDRSLPRGVYAEDVAKFAGRLP